MDWTLGRDRPSWRAKLSGTSLLEFDTNVELEQLGEALHDGLERVLELDLVIGAVEVRAEHDPRAALDEVAQGR